MPDIIINKINGNLFSSNANILCNAVNCIGIMGAGIAKQFKNRWLDMFLDYQSACNKKEIQIGKCHFYKLKETNQIIANVPTMFYPGEQSTEENLKASIYDLFNYAENTNNTTIAMPYLGCGIGQFKKSLLEKIITEYKPKQKLIIDLYQLN